MRNENFMNTGFDKGGGARRSFSPMNTGFEVDIESGAFGPCTGFCERFYFGVGPAKMSMKSFRNNSTAFDQNAAHQRVRMNPFFPSKGQSKRALHEAGV